MTRSYSAVKREVEWNEPPIEVNQQWAARGSSNEILRLIRILAPMPEPTGVSDYDGRVWIVQELPSKMIKLAAFEIRLVPEFNLRYVFRPLKYKYGARHD